MAAATGGGFHVSTGTIGADPRHVLVLITRRARGLEDSIHELRDRGHHVYLTWKECGRHQLEAWLTDKSNHSLADRLDGLINGWIAASPAAIDHLRSWHPRSRVIGLPTPYPIDLPSWQTRTLPAAERGGIFIGTREFGIPARRHMEAVHIARKLALARPGLSITVVNADGWRGSWKLWRATGGLNVLAFPPMSYKSYAEMMSRHRLVLQRDESGVPGQVAGDALLAGVPCLGGDGMIDRLAFAHLPSARDTEEAVMAEVEKLLDDEAHADRVMRVARESAMENLSFSAFRRKWERVLSGTDDPMSSPQSTT